VRIACTGAENQHDSKPSHSVVERLLTTDKGEVGGSSPPRPTINSTLLIQILTEFLATTAQADQKSSMGATWPEPEASRVSLVTSAAPSFSASTM
jgi:hypothetical protein